MNVEALEANGLGVFQRTARIAGNPTGVRTGFLPNTSLEHYRCSNLFRVRLQLKRRHSCQFSFTC